MTAKSLTIALCFLSAPALADAKGSVESAYRVCALFDSTGLASAPCEVTGWGSSVEVKIDMTAAEARKLCPQVAGMARDKGWSFGKGWTLKIYSPFSGGDTIAYCDL